MASQTHILPNISKSKGYQGRKFDLLRWLLENDKIFKFSKTMLFDTFISEENDDVIFVFEKIRKNLLFFHTNIQIRLYLSKTKKITSNYALSNISFIFLSLLNPQYFGCIMWMLLPKLLQVLSFHEMWFWGIT